MQLRQSVFEPKQEKNKRWNTIYYDIYFLKVILRPWKDSEQRKKANALRLSQRRT